MINGGRDASTPTIAERQEMSQEERQVIGQKRTREKLQTYSVTKISIYKNITHKTH